MRKISFFLVFVLSLSVVVLILSACVAKSPTPVTVTTTQTQTATQAQTTTQTITATQTPAATQTQTVTVTRPAVTVTAEPTQPPVTTPSVTTPAASKVNDFNTPRFFMRQEITSITRKVNPDGTVTETPVFQEIYQDITGGRFFTSKDAIFVPKIAGINNQDAWIVKFNIRSFTQIPVVLNWGHITNDQTPDSSFLISMWFLDDFRSKYLNNRSLLNGKGMAFNEAVSADGVHVQNLDKSGNMIAFVTTTNIDNLAGWWLKVGGAVIE